MRCPFCGSQLAFDEASTRVRCEATGAELTQAMVARLNALARQSTPEQRSTNVDWGGTWHCPVDGVVMTAAPDLLPECSTCGLVLPAAMIWQLIELHDHPRSARAPVPRRRRWFGRRSDA